MLSVTSATAVATTARAHDIMLFASLELSRFERDLPRDRERGGLAESSGLRESLHLRARMLRRPFLELRRFERADLNLVAVFEKPRSQRLTHNARADHANFHDVLLRQVQAPLRSAAPANSRGTGQGSPQGRSSRFDPQMLELAVRLGQ
jgi:hypothetical protein